MPYFTLDDPTLLESVRTDPTGFLKHLDRAIIDEVQRAPQLLLALKLSIDKDRRPGRFLLTGSANLMSLPQIADSLAGRIEIHTLLPLSQSEMAGRPCRFIQQVLEQDWSSVPAGGEQDIVQHVLTGGYPEMQHRRNPDRRQAWARSYLTSLMERDIQDIAQIEQIHQVPKLLDIAAEMSGQLLNLSRIGAQINLDHKTVIKYIDILEKMFLVRRLPAWSRNELSRLIKTPKIHFLDAGLQSTLTRLSFDRVLKDRIRFGATLETWVYGELLKILSVTPEHWYMSHYRDKAQNEVDFVLESPLREVIGIEVKAAASVEAKDFKGLRALREAAGKEFITGIILYTGDIALPFGDGMWAVPLHLL